MSGLSPELYRKILLLSLLNQDLNKSRDLSPGKLKFYPPFSTRSLLLQPVDNTHHKSVARIR